MDSFQQATLIATGGVIGLIVVLFAARRTVLLYRRWWPGPVVVPTVVDQTGESLPTLALTMTLRARITEVHLDAPALVPGSASTGTVLDNVRDAAEQSKTLVGRVARLLSVALPTHAYQVDCVLHRRASWPSCGVAAGLRIEPGRLVPLGTVWESTWDRGIERMAHRIAGSVLPRTRRCPLTPWSQWAGQRGGVPPALLDDYLEAEALVGELRYDEALEMYHRALAADPLNFHIRLRIGQLQEKLALRLDALTTYLRILRLGNSRKRHRRHVLRRRADESALVAAHYRYIVLAGFGERLALHWCKHDSAPRPRSDRDPEREALREEIIELLNARAAVDRLRNSEYDASACKTWDAWDGVTTDHARLPSSILTALDLATFFVGVSKYEAHDLRRSLFWSRFTRARHSAPTARSLRIIEHAWTETRVEWLNWLKCGLSESPADRTDKRDAPQGGDTKWPRAYTSVRDEILGAWAPFGRARLMPPWRRATPGRWWPFQATAESAKPATIEQATRRTTGRWIRPFRWVDHYNAACTYGVALFDDSLINKLAALLGRAGREGPPASAPGASDQEPMTAVAGHAASSRDLAPAAAHPDPSTHLATTGAPHDALEASQPTVTPAQPGPSGDLATAAAAHLWLAAEAGDSASIARRRDWLLSEDPDLAELRSTRPFRIWEAAHLPRPGPETRPADPHLLLTSRYIGVLMSRLAQKSEREWHRRAATVRRTTVDIHEIQHWWRGELDLWSAVGDFARNYNRWQTRHKTLRSIRGWLEDVKDLQSLSSPDYAYPLDGVRRQELSPAIMLAVREPDCTSEMAEAEVRARDAMLQQIAYYGTEGAVAGGAGEARIPLAKLRARTEEWADTADELDVRGCALPPNLAEACELRAAVWQGLRLMFFKDRRVDNSERSLVTAIDQEAGSVIVAEQSRTLRTSESSSG